MRIFKANYKNRNGQKLEGKKWYLDICDHNQTRHKIPAFSDKRLTEALGRNIESLVNYRISGLEPDAKLNQWIESLPENLLRKFVSWGLIEGQRAEITKPLTEHISDYIKIIEAKGHSKDYVRRTRNRLKKIISDCRFTYFRDITQSAVEIYSGKLKKDEYSDTSRAHYLDALKTFLNWAETDRRIIRNPILKLEKPARDSAKKGILTSEQFICLIKTTFEKNILIGRTMGQERAILYLLAGCTGLRRKELLNLTWDDISLSGNAFVRVRAAIAKNGQEAKQPIPAIVVNLLGALEACIRPQGNEWVFASFGKWINTAGLIREDLKTAKIGLKDKDGNEICFHSLRNSYISFLANSQTPAKVIQKLARHSDPRLTFNVYARTFEDAEQKALNYLPDFSEVCLGHLLGQNVQKTADSGGHAQNENGHNAHENALLAVSEIAPRGFEPLSPG